MYIQKLMQELHPFGDCLEVGFGSSSKEIQKYHPRSHTIISQDEMAVKWAKTHLNVKVIPDIWQGALPTLGVFDTIYFGIDPIQCDFLIKFRYTDEELETFCKISAKEEHLSRFLSELEQNGHITKEQKEKMIQKFGLTHAKPPTPKRSGEMIQFLKICLASHMRKGSRFSCLLKYEIDDSEFYNDIMVDPFLDIRQDGLIIVIEKLS